MAAIHEAALDSQLWPGVMAQMRSAFQDAEVRLGVLNRCGGPIFESATESDINLRLFRERYSTPQTNPGLAFAAVAPPLTVDVRERWVSDRDLVKLDFYNDIMRPADLWHAVVVNMHRDDRFVAPLGVMRRRSQGSFTDAEVRRLHRLAPHLNRAIRVTLRLKEMEARAEGGAEMSERAGLGLVLTDGFGRIAQANRLALNILDEADGLAIRDEVLRATAPQDRLRLGRLISEAAGGVDASQLLRPSGAMQVTRRWPRRPLPVVVSPTRAAASPVGCSHAVCVAFADPDRAPEADAEILARLHGLTSREAAVAVLLLQGNSPDEAAEALAITMNTMRTHIRRLFDKTGVDRLSELMRVLLRGPGIGIR